MAFGCFSEVIHLRFKQFILLTEFSICSPFPIKISWMFHEFTLWELAVWELLRNGNCVIYGLFPIPSCPIAQIKNMWVILLSWGIHNSTCSTLLFLILFLLLFLRVSSITSFFITLFIIITTLSLFLFFFNLLCRLCLWFFSSLSEFLANIVENIGLITFFFLVVFLVLFSELLLLVLG